MDKEAGEGENASLPIVRLQTSDNSIWECIMKTASVPFKSEKGCS